MVILLILVVCFFVQIVLLIQLLTSISRYKITLSELDKIKRLEDVPTVSLCIPARNETHALSDCLSSVIASDYPKLEVIVLDDCSQDETSNIIKGFAHDGVRFVKGEIPSDGWLGKNHAYQTLAQEARGEYLVFMSVDTRISPESISQLVSYMQLKKLSMTSVLPRRLDNLKLSVLLAPLRYFWQIVTPLKFNTPLATSLWAVQAENLSEIGGFEVHKDSIDLENRLASAFETKDEYRFLVASDNLKVSYEKQLRSQYDTAVRLWYPTLGRSFLKVTFVIFAHFILFVLPSLLLIQALLEYGSNEGYIKPFWVLALFGSFLSGFVYMIYFRTIKKLDSLTDMITIALSFFLLPILALQEIALIAISFVQYKRGKVSWKGRNICFPVLRKV